MKLVLAALLTITIITQAQPIRIACVGDSITFGARIKDRANQSYPAQLQKIIGHKFEIKNFGVNGATMLTKGNNPYIQKPAYKDSLDYQPNIVIIKLGSNDSKPQNWKFSTNFLPDTLKLIHSYQQLKSSPRIILCTPIPAYQNNKGQDVFGITNKIITTEQIPLLLQASQKTSIELINLHQEYELEGLESAKSKTPDHIHPNAAGATILAKRIAFQITNQFDTFFNIANNLTKNKTSFKVTNFHGYKKYDFTPSNTKLKCSIVAPHTTEKTHRWIWRARFFGHQPKLDLALLDRGYHLCYVNVVDLFGSPLAIKNWDNFYSFTQTLNLHPKPILEGMSRGGLIIFNWAKVNPEKVTAIYADNPVCDINSWPKADKPTNPTWLKCLKAYNLTNEQAIEFKGNPIDNLEKLAKANIPIIFSLGAKDTTVPIKENALTLSQRYRDLGATQIKTWINPDAGHHPHMACPFRELLNHTLSTTKTDKKNSN